MGHKVSIKWSGDRSLLTPQVAALRDFLAERDVTDASVSLEEDSTGLAEATVLVVFDDVAGKRSAESAVAALQHIVAFSTTPGRGPMGELHLLTTATGPPAPPARRGRL